MSQVKKILYTPPRGIGDIMFSLPLLHSLRSAYPQAKIFIPIARDKQEALDLVGFVDRADRYLPKPSEDPLAALRWQASLDGDKKEKYRLEKKIFDKYLAGEQFDLAIIPKDFRIDSISCGKQISASDLKNSGIQPESEHMVDGFLAFADYLNVPKVNSFELGVDLQKRLTLTSGMRLDVGKPYIVINMGASTDKKCWTQRGYEAVANWSRGRRLNVVLIGGKESFDTAREIELGGNNFLNLVLRNGHSLNLENLAILASKCDAFVSPDTGPLHIADAVGANVVGLYGPTSPKKFGPYNNMANVVSKFDSSKNMKDIKYQEVIAKLEEILK